MILARSLLIPTSTNSNQFRQTTHNPTQTMNKTSYLAALALCAVSAASGLRAETNSVSSGKETKQPIPLEAPAPAFTGTITAAYDSMYNFRGIDWIPNTGMFDFTFAPCWHITANDTLTVPLWFCVAVGQTGNSAPFNGNPYTELDIPINYMHTFGNFGLGCGYTMYNYFNYGFPKTGTSYVPGGTGIQHEINVTANYTVKTGAVAWTPSITYFYELGQAAPYNYASINAGSSFLSPALAVAVPLYKDIVSFNPVTQYNISFGYNVNNNRNADGTPTFQKVYGFNNWQLVAPVTWKITQNIALTGYAAYTYQPNLMNSVSWTATPISKFYCGASVAYSF